MSAAVSRPARRNADQPLHSVLLHHPDQVGRAFPQVSGGLPCRPLRQPAHHPFLARQRSLQRPFVQHVSFHRPILRSPPPKSPPLSFQYRYFMSLGAGLLCQSSPNPACRCNHQDFHGKKPLSLLSLPPVSTPQLAFPAADLSASRRNSKLETAPLKILALSAPGASNHRRSLSCTRHCPLGHGPPLPPLPPPATFTRPPLKCRTLMFVTSLNALLLTLDHRSVSRLLAPLQQWGVTAEVESEPDYAIAALLRRHFDGFIAEFTSVPGVPEALGAIRSATACKSTPILALIDDSISVQSALEGGANSALNIA